MSRWYENKQSNLFGEQCDDALDNQDCETLLKLVEKAWQLGYNTHNSNKSYAHYEREHEKCPYLCRQAIKLVETFRDNELTADDKMKAKYFHGFHC